MKVRKIVILTVIMTLIFGTAAFANSIGQRVRVIVNKTELDDGGVLIDGKSYLPLRSLTDTLQALLIWDDSAKKASIFKPNVHMFTMQGNTPFGSVPKAGRYKFYVFSQIDNLKVDISAFKISITDPYGELTWIDSRVSGDKDFPESGKDNFWVRSKEISYEFKPAGKYTIRFWMKPAGEADLQIVSEKVITL